MLKHVQIKVKKIKYSGNSIGDDIRLEVEALGKIFRLDKKIKVDTTIEKNSEFASFETNEKIFKADLAVTVIEKDLMFNDVGKANSILKVDTSIKTEQQLTIQVQVKENRSVAGVSWGKAVAVFEIIIEAHVSEAIKYIPDESNGWLKVVLKDSAKKEPLPAFLKVKVEYLDGGREFFTILEGPYRGKTASVALKNDGSSWLITDLKNDPPPKLTYSISKKILTLKGNKYKTTDYRNAPWKKGLYDIEIPDYPHQGGTNYLNKAPRAKTWFRIGHSGEKYLHTGGISLGCMTITESSRWGEVYDALIKARKGDFVSVGIIEIID